MLKFDREDTFNLSPFARWKFKPEFKCFAGWGQCWRCHSLLGLEALWPPIPGSSHCSWTCQGVTTSSHNPGGTKTFLHTELAPTNLSQLAGLKERSWIKSLFLWTCLYEAIFVCTQTHVYKQLSSDYHSNEGIFRISTRIFFFWSGSQTSAVPTKNMKWEVKSFDLARARNTSEAGARSSPRGLFYQEQLISVQAVQSLGLLFVWRKTDPEWISLTDGLSSTALSLTLGMMLTAEELNAASAELGNFPSWADFPRQWAVCHFFSCLQHEAMAFSTPGNQAREAHVFAQTPLSPPAIITCEMLKFT